MIYELVPCFFTHADGTVTLQCPQPQHCLNASITVTCMTLNNVLAWYKSNVNNPLVVYTVHSVIGTNNNFGQIQTSLDQRNPTLSTMNIIPDISLQGLIVSCI